MTTDGNFDARLQILLRHALAQLDPADLAERIQWCREHTDHGVTMHLDDADDLLEFRWGGRCLALVYRRVLDDDSRYQVGFTGVDL
ncbi:MAG TPA: hypothetical protein VLU24_08420 [Mycobacterium sp.]|nr:hypothetical protein [Mycobacterium sp.]